MAQSSVEWLLNNLLINGFLRLTEDEHKLYKELKEEAEVIHMEEILQCYDHGLLDGTMNHVNYRVYKSAEQYYNETFGQ